jgi:phosphate-selective porin OprO/OprP
MSPTLAPRRRLWSPLLVLVAIAAVPALLRTSSAQEDQPVAGDLSPILRRLEDQQREIEQLRAELAGVREEITCLPPVDVASEDKSTPVASGLADPLDARVKALEGDIKKMKEAEKKKAGEFPTHKITGFLQLDTAYYGQSPANIATVGDAQDGTGFRRARFAVNGKVSEFTNYQIEVDFATAGRPSFFDNYVEETNVPWFGNVKAGQYCQPFSVDALTGFRNLTFLERSLPFLALVPFRRVGIQASNMAEDEMTQWAYSVYRTGGFNNAPLGDDRFATDFGDLGGYSFAARSTHLLYYDEHAGDRYLWHIGGGYTFAMLGANDAGGAGAGGNAGSPVPFYQARTAPEFNLGYPELTNNFGSGVNSTPNFVDTGKYAANFFSLYGLETVYQAGPWGVQAEYMATVVDSVSAGSIVYQGAYAQLAYRLTGENHVYDKKNGTHDTLDP